jgi:hypothetical protein
VKPISDREEKINRLSGRRGENANEATAAWHRGLICDREVAPPPGQAVMPASSVVEVNTASVVQSNTLLHCTPMWKEAVANDCLNSRWTDVRVSC